VIDNYYKQFNSFWSKVQYNCVNHKTSDCHLNEQTIHTTIATKQTTINLLTKLM